MIFLRQQWWDIDSHKKNPRWTFQLVPGLLMIFLRCAKALYSTLLTCSLETHGNWFFDQTVLSMVGTAGGPRGCLDLKNKKMQWWRALKVPPLGSNFQLRMMKDLIKRDLGTWNKETMNISFILRSTAGQDIISSRENYKAIIIWWFLKIEQRFHICK